MIRNYLKIALRNFRKQLSFTLINVTGLSLGIGCCMLILLWVQDELSYDRFHPHAGQIFRITNQVKNSFVISSPGLLGQKLKEEIPAVLDATDTEFSPSEAIFKQGQEYFSENGFLYVKPSFLHIFHFPLEQGVDSLALERPFSLVLSRKMAKKYFPGKNAVGERLELADGTVFEITGVLAPLPENSSLQFQFLASAATLEKTQGRNLSGWNDGLGISYVLTTPGYTTAQLQADIQKVIKDNHAPGDIWEFTVMALRDIHLHATVQFGNTAGVQGKMQYVYIFASTGILVLLIACINFINMSTARSLERTKEVGVRKAIGALRKQLITQFMSESMLLVTVALMVGYFLAWLLLPQLNRLSQKSMELSLSSHPFLWPTLILFIPVVTLLAGLYPSLVLSAFQPVKVLKGGFFQPGRGKLFLRNALMVVQFAISTMLVICTLIMWQQLSYVRNTDLGFDKEQILMISNPNQRLQHFPVIKHALMQLPAVTGVTSGRMMGFSNAWFEQADSSNQVTRDLTLYGINVDEDFLDLLHIQLAQGRPFAKNSAHDRQHAVILNEKAVEVLGLKQPLGAQIKTMVMADTGGFNFTEKAVIGVLAAHVSFEGLKREEYPLVIQLSDHLSDVLIKVSTRDVPHTLEQIHQAWSKLDTGIPFDYVFLDDAYDNLYRQDMRVGTAFMHFAAVAMIIAALGLIGLSAYALKRRTKEISIRKVFGASVSSLLLLLSKDYFRLIIIAILIAVPVANYFIREWLGNFAAKVDIAWWWFTLPGLLILMVALISIISQTLKTARQNPVDNLRYE